MTEKTKLQFHGGWIVSAFPMLFFIVWAISVCLLGAPDVKGLLLGMVIGLALTMFLSKGGLYPYCEEIFAGMASKIGVIAIVCWLWAGIFAQVLRAGGLVEGLVWLSRAAGVGGGLFTCMTFLLAAVFASAVGTGYGTTVAFCTLLYPTGLLLGAQPVILFGAILSGAAFGDNLAPVSDTTIVSAATQDADVPGVVRSRFKYAAAAALPAAILFLIFGSSGGGAPPDVDPSAAAAVAPNGLALLVPFALVIGLAMSGRHIITSLTVGIATASGFILVLGLCPGTDLLAIDAGKQVMTGALVDGIAGYVDMCVLILLIMSANHIMHAGGAMAAIKDLTLKAIRGSVRRAEIAMWAFVSCLNFFITVNTAAEIAAAPFIREIGREFKLHPYRRANFLDAVSSALGYIFPWSGGVLIGYATLAGMAKGDYDWITVVSPTEVWPYVFHGWLLFAVMLLAAVTGFGRRFVEDEEG